MTISDCLMVLFVLMLLQLLGTHLQVHKLGNLGVGSSKQRLGAGSVVIISCKSDGTITGGEEMRGFTIFSGFKEIPNIVGRSIYDLKSEYSSLPDKERKTFKAHLQALEALEIRLHNDKASAETSEVNS